MSLESKPGHECKVTLGATQIIGLGVWSYTGGSYAALDDTDFGDDDNRTLRGVRTGGKVTFSGRYKKDDTTGQDKIRDAFWLKSDLTDIRFYVDDTSYYTPNSTTAAGGGLPADTMVSHVKIMTEPNISVDQTALTTIEMEATVEGALRLV